ncbi:MAG: hypothetical protein RI995_2088, partial [Bacteroidota bacterium]
GETVNHVLTEVIQQVDLKGFHEIIPGFDDIFIEVVNQTKA